ncbi:avirulence protein 1b [Phytophthora sojae]|uniref:RxLR effector protein n=2 Tax=Phytophthora sojae TaxID=67593 RepID=G5A457_PHYSP|nr:avirulence protein 1b [Phytophthora sojae]AEK80530.1 Avh35 [Phytophthora sojae]AEK80532.1 Avh35 [Phytophthora sojae]EGZ09503.1 avirulence protein 1b [Phytophthora sojae]|eukprot:XP_009534364.1 avirulence protein 1b [Phytophthora sojae]
MRPGYVLLLVAAALVGTLDAAAGGTAVAPSKPKVVNRVDLDKSTGNDHRFLRSHKVDYDNSDGYDASDDAEEAGEEEEEEEMGWVVTLKANAVLLRLSMTNSADNMGPILAEIRDAGVLAAFFEKLVPHLKRILPAYENGLDVNKFDGLLQASNLSDDVQTVQLSAYSKYWFTNH